MKKRIAVLLSALMAAILLLGMAPTIQGQAASGGTWKKAGNKWYFYDVKSNMAKDAWVLWNGKWYYVQPDGVMKTGWFLEDGKWYYLQSGGAMKTGWLRENGKWYYLQSGGAMKTGWYKEKGQWYYLKPNGDMATGWYMDNGKWYYSYQSGVMAASTVISNEIGSYKLGADGAWIQDGTGTDTNTNTNTDTNVKKIRIGIDPGHQSKANRGQEPNAPGSSVNKNKVSSGTQGRFTGVAEYIVNLQVGLQLRDALEKEGIEVVMSRTTHDVNISNKERAELFNKEGVDLVIRLHCDGNESASKNGVSILIPSNKCTKDINEASKKAADCALKRFVEHTGAKNNGLKPRDDQTGFNWSTVPVYNIEMGYMTNKAEDNKLVSEDYQKKIVKGIVAGIHDYFY